MQFSGSPTQSVLHRKRSQDSQPIGGVRAKPFSKPFAVRATQRHSSTATPVAAASRTVLGHDFRVVNIIGDLCMHSML